MRSISTRRVLFAIVAALAAAVVIAAAPVAGQGTTGETASRIRIRGYPQTDGEKAAYTIRVDSFWENGGYLHVNFPEHLEYGPVGYTIARYSDLRPPSWLVIREGKFAHYEVASIPGRGVEGVTVQATAQVIEPDRVRMTLAIINRSDKALQNIKPLLCFQYKGLAGFPGGGDDNFKYTYVVVDGRITALADIPTTKPNATAKAAPVKGVEPYRFDFAKKRGGYIHKPLDLGLSVITSKDGARAVILYAPVGESVLSNLAIPCLHADPCFGHIQPGESKERTVEVTFAGPDWRRIVESIVKRHARPDLPS